MQDGWTTRGSDVRHLHTAPVPQSTDVSRTQARLLVIQNVVEEVVDNTQAPVDMVEFCALAAISLATQQLINVRLPQIGVVPTSLMLMIIANSGERKSTVESKLFKAIRDFEEEKQFIFEKEYKDWSLEYKIWQTKHQALKKRYFQYISKNQPTENIESDLRLVMQEEPTKPSPAKILYDDATSKALYLGLQDSLPFAGLVSSEGGSILKSGVLNDTPKLNAIWSGDPIKMDRVTSESVHIRKAKLTVSIMVQPDMLSEFLKKKGDQARGSGLMARFLLSSGESTQGTRVMVSGDQQWNFLDIFNNRIRQFIDESYQSVTAPSFEPKTLELSPEAEKLWIDFYNDTERKINTGEKYESFGDHASKLAENIGRVAAILHKFEKRHGKIEVDIMEQSISICQDSSNNFLSVFDSPAQDIQDAQTLFEWIHENKNKHPRGEIRKNYILQYCPNKFRGKDIGKVRLERALDVLSHDKRIDIFKVRGTTYVCIK